jgi:hypothetical protein
MIATMPVLNIKICHVAPIPFENESIGAAYKMSEFLLRFVLACDDDLSRHHRLTGG